MPNQPRYANQEIDGLLRVLSGYASEPEKGELAKLATLQRECDLEATRKTITESLELLARVDALLSARPTHRNLTEASHLLVRIEEVLARLPC